MGPRVAEPSRAGGLARERRRLGQAMVGSRPVVAMGRGLVRLLARSLRLREFTSPAVQALRRDDAPLIYTVWHGQILLLPLLYGRRYRVHAMTSRSRDGDMLTLFVAGFGIRPVRGSSSRDGARALRALVRVIRDLRESALIVPDGPRGPRRVAQSGAVVLARMTGAPIVPVGFGAVPCRVLQSWDRFVVPSPFARAAVVFGEPFFVPRDADPDTMEAKRLELEAALNHVSAEADRAAGGTRVPAL